MSEKRLPKIGWTNNVVETRFELRSVYDLLDVIRKKPGLFTGEPSVTGLWHFVHGFQSALQAVDQPFERDEPPFSEFHNWIANRLGFSESARGWKNMLLESTGEESAAFDRFFDELDAFRASANATE